MWTGEDYHTKIQILTCGYHEIAVKKCDKFKLHYKLEDMGFTEDDIDENGKIFKDGEEIEREWFE